MAIKPAATATLAVGQNLLLAADLQALSGANLGRFTKHLVAVAPVGALHHNFCV